VTTNPDDSGNSDGLLKTLGSISERAEGVELHSLRFKVNGGFEIEAPKLPMSFRFAWHEQTFEGDLEQRNEGIVLRLRADIGILPYTSEDPAARRQLIEEVSASGTRPTGRLELVDNHHLHWRHEVQLPTPKSLTIKTILTNIAVLILLARPYFDATTMAPASGTA
jgi:hypothetical protein